MERIKIGVAEFAACRERDVERAGRVAFGEYEAVIGTHDVVVQQHERIYAGEIAAEMANSGTEMHVQ